MICPIHGYEFANVVNNNEITCNHPDCDYVFTQEIKDNNDDTLDINITMSISASLPFDDEEKKE